MDKQNYHITKGNFNGSEETVWVSNCTLQEAERQFTLIVEEQTYAFHIAKTIPMWRKVRLYDDKGAIIKQG